MKYANKNVKVTTWLRWAVEWGTDIHIQIIYVIDWTILIWTAEILLTENSYSFHPKKNALNY